MSASTSPAELPPPLAALVRDYLRHRPGPCSPKPVFAAAPIAGDGSDRRYFRVTAATRPETFIAVDAAAGWDKFHRRDGRRLTENHSFMLISRHLAACDLPVPAILASAPRARYYLLQDLGDTTVYHFVQQHGWQPATVELYRQIIRLLATLQLRAAAGFNPDWAYGGGFYDHQLVVAGELEYFYRAYCGRCLGLTLTPRQREALERDFHALAAAALEAPGDFFLYRDFQAKNLMLHRQHLYLIDFQGARRGPLYYDLASLLNDPYVQMPAAIRRQLRRYYYAYAGEELGLPLPAAPVFHRFFTLFSLIRNLQVLGAFAFLSQEKQRPQFRRYIPRARRTLAEVASRREIHDRFPALASLLAGLPAATP